MPEALLVFVTLKVVDVLLVTYHSPKYPPVAVVGVTVTLNAEVPKL